MKYLSLDVFDNFVCVGSDCSDTCCKDWVIFIDDDSADIYRNVQGDFGDKLRQNMITKEGEVYFRLPNRYCAFLTEQKLCEICLKLGEDKMCYTCKTYPRFDKPYGDILFHGLNLSCPEVARKVLLHKGLIQFDFVETGDSDNNDVKENDWVLFNTLITGLTTGINIVQRRDISFPERLGLLILFNDALQEHLDSGKDCSSIFEAFAPERLVCYLDAIRSIPTNPNAGITFLSNFIKNLDQIPNYNIIIPLIDGIKKTLDGYNSLEALKKINKLLNYTMDSDNSILYEQYCVYFLFSHYMDAYSSKKPLEYVTLLVYLLYIHKCISIFRMADNNKLLSEDEYIEIYSKTSRFFEHSPKGKRLHSLYQMNLEAGLTDTVFLLSLVKM